MTLDSNITEMQKETMHTEQMNINRKANNATTVNAREDQTATVDSTTIHTYKQATTADTEQLNSTFDNTLNPTSSTIDIDNIDSIMDNGDNSSVNSCKPVEDFLNTPTSHQNLKDNDYDYDYMGDIFSSQSTEHQEDNNEPEAAPEVEDVQLTTQQEAQEALVSLLKEVKEVFGLKAGKKILKQATKIAGYDTLTRESIHQLEPIDLTVYKARIRSFQTMQLNFDINIGNNNTVEGIYEDCCIVYTKILSFQTTKWASEVAMFGGFLKMYQLLEKGARSSNPKQFDDKMKKYLNKQGSAYSKYKQKCRRVNEIACLYNPATAVLLAYNIKIATLENASRKDWNSIIQDLGETDGFEEFSRTIQLDETGLLPRFLL
ncbi:unnamed protein product [Mucor fragilis]